MGNYGYLRELCSRSLEFREVPVTVAPVTTEIASLVVRNAAFSMIVRRPSMKKMRASLDFSKDIAAFIH